MGEKLPESKRAHLASAGYTCEKGLRINYYQNNTSRLTTPLRGYDGSYLKSIGLDIGEISSGPKKSMKSMALVKSSTTAVGDKVITSAELIQQQPGRRME